jgi:hypothetical protein
VEFRNIATSSSSTMEDEWAPTWRSQGSFKVSPLRHSRFARCVICAWWPRQQPAMPLIQTATPGAVGSSKRGENDAYGRRYAPKFDVAGYNWCAGGVGLGCVLVRARNVAHLRAVRPRACLRMQAHAVKEETGGAANKSISVFLDAPDAAKYSAETGLSTSFTIQIHNQLQPGKPKGEARMGRHPPEPAQG